MALQPLRPPASTLARPPLAAAPAPADKHPHSQDALMKTLEGQKKEYAALRDMQIRADANSERFEKELALAEEETRAAFGTDDPAALIGNAVEREAIAAVSVKEYEEALAEVRIAVAAITGRV